MIIAIQSIGLFFGIWFSVVNIMKACNGHSVPFSNFIIMSAGLTAFIMATWFV